MTDDPLAGDDDDDDDKFELSLATISNQRVKMSGSHLHHFFEAVFFVYYQQLVMALKMVCRYNSSSTINIYLINNAHAGVNGFYTQFLRENLTNCQK